MYRGTTTGFQVNTLTDTPLAQPSSNSYSDNNGLTEYTTYYYKVAAVDNAGNIGILSAEKSGTTLDSIAPSKVLGLNITPVSSSQLDLVWTSNTEPDPKQKPFKLKYKKQVDQKTRFQIAETYGGVSKQYQQDKDRKDIEVLKLRANEVIKYVAN